ncbi:transposable element Tc1 transposase [Trichonephila clavipes]|nr:transposable element Tc1 transposase [Trichonephila clavipes]
MANNQSVRRHLEAFTRGRIIGKLEEGRSVTSVAAELTTSFHDFGDNFKLQEQLSGGSVVVVHEEPHPHMTGTLSYRPEETGGRQREKSLDTRHRRSLWCREHRNWRDNEWGRVLFTDESRFSLSSDSHRILIWRERGSRNNPSNIIERDRYGGRGGLVWGASCLEVVQTFTSSTQRHYASAAPFHGRQCTMSSHSSCRTALRDRRLAARTLPPVTIRELRLALQDEWAAMPQQLIDTLILSMGRRCETCLAVMGDHIPY